MTLTIERTHFGKGANDIRITRTWPDRPIEYIFMSHNTLKDLVFWARWYESSKDAKAALGCDLKPGEVTHVG